MTADIVVETTEHMASLDDTFLLPFWFLKLANPLVSGMYAVVLLAALICLALGLIRAIAQHEAGAWLFVVSPIASHVFVGVADAMTGAIRGTPALTVAVAFVVLQTAGLVTLIARTREPRATAYALAAFCLVYGGVASFVGLMSFENDW